MGGTQWCWADDFLGNFEGPLLQMHGAKRILAAHPQLHLFFDRHLQEAVQFFIQFLADLFLSEQRTQSV